MKNLLLIVSILAFTIAQGQQAVSHKYYGKKIKSFDPRLAKTDHQVSVEKLEAPSPGGDSYRSYLLQLKEEISKRYPIRNARGSMSGDPILNPTIERDFGCFNGPDMDRINLGGTPNDNTLAVSNEELFVTSYNTQIYFHDLKADTPMYRPNPFRTTIGFQQFALENDSIGTNFPFDPKLLYDPVADRFILVFLSGRTPDDSKNIVAFSSSNDPSDPWNVYELSGNPKGNRTWTDYPAIAMTDDELFLTINLLRENEPWQTGFEETIIWQMDKEAGVNGLDSLPAKWWGGINFGNKPIRNLNPIQGGKELVGPDIWFLSNRNFDIQNDTIFMVHITGKLDDPSAQLEVKFGLSDVPYGAPPNARQANNHFFDTNDGRILGGFIDGKYVQFVANSIDTNSGRSAVYHGIIQDITASQPAVDGEIIVHDSYDIGYPNIAQTGNANGDYSSIIGFDHSSPTDFAGFSAVYYDGSGEYSEIIKVIEGEGYVDRLSSPSDGRLYERWGDYTGIQRMYNDPRRVWISGYYGLDNLGNSIWMAELSTHNYVASKNELNAPGNLKPYPNPANDFVSFKFDLEESQYLFFELLDMSGRRVHLFGKDQMSEGLHELRFSTSEIPSGTYILNIRNESNSILREKLVIN